MVILVSEDEKHLPPFLFVVPFLYAQPEKKLESAVWQLYQDDQFKHAVIGGFLYGMRPIVMYMIMAGSMV